MAVQRQKHEAVLLNDGRVLVVGGSDAEDNRYSSTVIYDPRQGSFVPGPALHSPRHKIAGSVVVTEGGDVIVAGGAPYIEVLPAADGTDFVRATGELDDLREFTTAVPVGHDGSSSDGVIVRGSMGPRLIARNIFLDGTLRDSHSVRKHWLTTSATAAVALRLSRVLLEYEVVTRTKEYRTEPGGFSFATIRFAYYW